jgi:glycosyltransferase involved in cell wall biosynthesis
MDRLASLGADRAKLHVLRNGVDLDLFIPLSRSEARLRLGLGAASHAGNKLILSVGHLIERKGHHIAIEAMPLLSPSIRLLIVGEGELRDVLEKRVRELGLNERVLFVGALPQADLKWWYAAADALVLCSSREGWANVLLEAMACGTPVVATNIWGTPEVVSAPDAGRLMGDRSPAGLAEGLRDLFDNYPGRDAVRLHAEKFSWQDTTQGQLDLFRDVVAGSAQS